MLILSNIAKKSVTCHGSPKVSLKNQEWGLQQNLQYLIFVLSVHYKPTSQETQAEQPPLPLSRRGVRQKSKRTQR